MSEKLPTINLKGKEYVQVKERVIYFNENHPNGAIKTKIIESSGGVVTFKATIYPDIATKDRFFTGHSFGTLKEVKAFEKLESVAVGRALALMGIGIIESIASADEMVRFEQKEVERVKKELSNYTPCPVCNKDRRAFDTKSGKVFVGCQTWGECVKKDKQATYWI